MSSSVIRDLITNPSAFEFFQAVRLWNKFQSYNRLYFKSSSGLGFPSSDISRMEKTGQKKYKMELHFMGLKGSTSPLPAYLTDGLHREKESAAALSLFLEMFENRIYTLYGEAWKKYTVLQGERFLFTERLNTTEGLGNTGNVNETNPMTGSHVLARSFVHGRNRSAFFLEKFLQTQFNFPRLKVLQFQNTLLPIPNQTRLGCVDSGVLGKCRIGEKVSSAAFGIAVCLGKIPAPWLLGRSPWGGPSSLAARISEAVNLFVQSLIKVAIRLEYDRPRSGYKKLGSASMVLGRGAGLGRRMTDKVVININF